MAKDSARTLRKALKVKVEEPLRPGERCYHRGQMPMLTMSRNAVGDDGFPRNDGTVVCMWFDSHNELHYDTFKRTELTRGKL